MKNYGYWLIPAEKDFINLKKIISDLAASHKSIAFDPHLSLFNTTKIDLNTAISTVNSAIDHIKPFTINTKKVDASEKFFKSVFINCAINADLSKLNSRLTESLKKYSDYSFQPHISLLYKETLLVNKNEIAKNITIPKSFRMDRVVIVDTGKKDEDLYNISAWKVVHTAQL